MCAWRSAGSTRGQQEAFRALLIVLALAALSVVAVMLIQFRSLLEPLVILLAAPLSFVGALVLLLVTGTPLNVSSLMGLILLVGLIVKNGIILLDFTSSACARGEPLEPRCATRRGPSAPDPDDHALHPLRAAAAGARTRRGRELQRPLAPTRSSAGSRSRPRSPSSWCPASWWASAAAIIA